MRERAAAVDAFVALNRYYADFMADYLAVDRSKVHVIPHGLKLDGHGRRIEKPPDEPRVIGYLARICEDKGLHLLVDACEQLAERDDMPAVRCASCRLSRRRGSTVFGIARKARRRRAARGTIRIPGRTRPAAEDRIPTITRRIQHADRLPRIEGPAGVGGHGERRPGGAT